MIKIIQLSLNANVDTTFFRFCSLFFLTIWKFHLLLVKCLEIDVTKFLTSFFYVYYVSIIKQDKYIVTKFEWTSIKIYIYIMIETLWSIHLLWSAAKVFKLTFCLNNVRHVKSFGDPQDHCPVLKVKGITAEQNGPLTVGLSVRSVLMPLVSVTYWSMPT